MKTSDVVAWFGTKKAIAEACTNDGWKLTAAAVSQWGEEPPAGRQKQLASLTNGELTTNSQNPIEEAPAQGNKKMTDNRIEDLNIESIAPLVTPAQLKEEMPISDAAIDSVRKGRDAVRDILDRKDHRIFVVIGPCSIHDVEAAKDYAH